ncbi:hypothetical protein LUZ63_000753 [Rhynchospora breviuscula]|uniref:RNase H type-1 domain-containing protein n=1 Tax=Rhynchospora breviuscula TaxID=2022672 RepID=A0A9Q0CVH8_9POAL|nr:hypothetical protein LUZ63_000753 [Rhynchospora breviuscula]
MTRPILTGRLARWAVALMEFDITYAPQKAIKGQALADFLAAHPITDDSPLASIKPNLPKRQGGVGLAFVTPEKGILRYALSLTEPCINNEAEYEALIAGLDMAINMGIDRLKVFGDSQLILSQIEGRFQIRKLELVKYHEKALKLMAKLTSITLEKVPRSLNGKTDALARLANELSDPDQEEIQILVHRRSSLSPCFQETEGGEEEEETTFVDIISLEKELEEE